MCAFWHAFVLFGMPAMTGWALLFVFFNDLFTCLKLIE